MSGSLTVSFCTLGCRVNRYETDAISEAFVKEGFTVGDFESKCDVYVINTCTVTGESDRKSRQMIRRAIKRGGETAVVMAVGCFTQVSPDEAEKITGLDYIGGNKDKLSVAKHAKQLLLKKRSGNAFERRVNVCDISDEHEFENMSIHSSVTTRSFVKISDGCNNACSYCIIPAARGPVRSKSIDCVVDEIKALTNNGYKETVLTGIETAAYGKDLKNVTLCDLLEKVNNIEKLSRIRLGSLEPTIIRGGFADRVKNLHKVMPHYHLSLQSGNDAVLAAMRRRYNTGMFYEGICNLREKIPDVTFTTDIIVGFPGETDEMFCDSVEFAKKCGFLFMHIFPFSKRKGTEAADMKCQIPEEVKRQRVSEMEKVMWETRQKVLTPFMGRRFEVLNESPVSGKVCGYTPNFIQVKAQKIVSQGDFTMVDITEIENCTEFVYGV